MNTYEAYKNKAINLSAFGLDRCGNDYTYFCTPVGADIFAAPGVDGIHYCMIEGFGELVFAISPSNGVGEFVHPVARNFDDFLRLLLVCDGDAAIEQCWQWSQEQFDKFMGEQEVLPATKQAAERLMEQTGLEPMELPYKYIRDLQKSFNYKSISFSEEYYDIVPPEDLAEPEEILCEQSATPWAVYYGDNFWADTHDSDPCEEISFEKHFCWADREWYIPSIYTCDKGMVVDIMMRVNAVEFQSFVDRWGVTVENEHTFSREQRKRMEQENPLIFHFNTALNVNGIDMPTKSGCSTVYAPSMAETHREEQLQLMDYYNLDRNACWVMQRSTYPWTKGQIKEITTLEITMRHQPMYLSGPVFEIKASGETVSFVNPVTGIEHRLFVQAFEAQEQHFDFADAHMPKTPELEYPSHFHVMSYTLEPNASEKDIRISDHSQGDSPREKNGGKRSGASSVGIIFCHKRTSASGEEDESRIAVSSLHFEPTDHVEWSISFREKQIEDKTIELM